MVRRAASSSSATSGIERQAVATMAMITELVLSWSQLMGSWMSPTPMRMPLMIPEWVSKMKRQIMPVTTDATAQGVMTPIRNSPEPRNRRLRMSAVRNASGRVTRVTAAAKPRVLGMVSRTTLSMGSRVT